ncbi:MAG: hypothetical protein JST92_11670, partial [Deltaproteobacteria bacterium]|nr:hypothetical protein [Deltaproteobacteria bacterium]
MGSHRAVALAVCLLLGTAARGDEEPPKTSLEAAPGSPGVVRKSELVQLLASTDRIAGQLSKLRGLPLKHPFKHGLHSRQEILEYVIQQMDRHEPPAKLAADELALRELGVIGPGDDYRKLLLEVLSEQIAGFYDPSAQTLYVADWIPAQAQSITLAHEIGHALQDQSFPLEAFVAEDKGNTDLTLARQALVEGDGVAQMILFQMMLNGITADVWADGSMGDRLAEGMANESKQGSPALMRAPLYLRESLLFPYVTGLRFVSALRKGKAWDAVDAGFRAPPASTEQVMHPEKYFAHEQPVEVKVAAPPSLAAWTRVYDDVMGEAGFLFWFRQLGVPERVAERASA